MTKLTRLAGNGLAAATLGLALPMAADAASVTIDSVVQRWPWNNKVDITYTVTDAQVRTSGVYYGINFTLSANGQTYAIEGSSLGASTESGNGSRQYTITWTAPEGIACTDASLTATLFATNVPSGNDYMVVDLTTGAIAYEGLCATQADSNARYNTAEFKTDKLVLRKVPRTADSAALPNGPFASGYPTGDSALFPSGNDRNTTHRWTTDRDYYIGVFLVTQRQYQNIYGSNPSLCTTAISGNEVAHRPVENVSWKDLRANASSADQIPAVSAANTGSFFQRLNYKTGLYFDMPTEQMFEIAARAGATTVYSWGNTMDTAYVVCNENSGGSTVAVGSRLPNAWGLYDTAGNLWDRTRDTRDTGDLGGRRDAFSPGVGSGSQANRIRLRGGHWNLSSSHNYFRASHRDCTCSITESGNEVGFRVAVIVE